MEVLGLQQQTQQAGAPALTSASAEGKKPMDVLAGASRRTGSRLEALGLSDKESGCIQAKCLIKQQRSRNLTIMGG